MKTEEVIKIVEIVFEAALKITKAVNMDEETIKQWLSK